MINEFNNNTIFAGNAKKKMQLPDSVVDTKKDIGTIPGLYRTDDGYRPYTIYGNSGEFSLLSFPPSNSQLTLSLSILFCLIIFLLPVLVIKSFFYQFW